MAHAVFNRVSPAFHTVHRTPLIHAIREVERHFFLGLDTPALVLCHNGKAILNLGGLTVSA